MLIALSGRISLDHAAGVGETTVLREIWEQHFVLAERVAAPGDRSLELDDPDALRREPEESSDRARRQFKIKPKELTGEPDLAAGAGGGGLAVGAEREPRRNPDRRPGSTSFGDEAGGLDDEEGEPAGHNREVRARAKEIAARLELQEPPPRVARPGGLEIRSLPYRGGGGELDLDRTLDVLAEQPAPSPEDLTVRERRRTKREIVLAVDLSGSMRGERLLTAAATVGALCGALHRDDLAVIAFWSDAAVLLRLGEEAEAGRVIDALLGLDAAGLTNVSFPLEFAATELGAPGRAEQRVLLLSDCVHNAGPDPRIAAARLPRLDVLFDLGGERDSDLAAGLARAGRGTVLPIRNHRDAPPALNRALARS
jgi:Mg-chelatase subunit ChlD